jgi:riboflavin biosynthesis pyrimidine reductase
VGRALAERRLGDVIELGDHVDPATAIEALRARGFERTLTEGGPRLMASMLAAGVVEELFVTISPKLIGGGPGRPPLTDGAEDLDLAAHERLLSARRAGDYLLLRYALASPRGHRGDRSR